ncbi:hypothetical protein Celaphus_00015897 [Cervus elaphus hippelaphus]|uniref:Uncharacterized protein n=1 Tax=Cervus elaphus hippelaphus TaxID=46360 RepID=A0A212C1P6_CEREH|nr:hypothetical protein Celaphus_00015897 [Cervus elaphus hippelaphus]
MEQPVQNGGEDCPLGGGEGHHRQVNDGLGGEGDDMEIFMEEMREIRRKQGAAVEELSAYPYGGAL